MVETNTSHPDVNVYENTPHTGAPQASHQTDRILGKNKSMLNLAKLTLIPIEQRQTLDEALSSLHSQGLDASFLLE